jgi:hypothetical protein
VYVSCVAEPDTLLRRLWKEKVVGSSFVRGGGLQALLNRDHAKLLAQHRQEPLRFANNVIVPEELLPRAQPFSARRISGIIEKMVRCLYFHETSKPMTLPAQFDVSNEQLSPVDSGKLYDLPTGFVGDNGEFFYYHEDAGKRGTRWLFGFYRMQTFDVHVIAS